MIHLELYLEEQRIKSDLTIEQFCKRIGIDKRNYYRYLYEKRLPSGRNLNILTNYFGSELVELVMKQKAHKKRIRTISKRG